MTAELRHERTPKQRGDPLVRQSAVLIRRLGGIEKTRYFTRFYPLVSCYAADVDRVEMSGVQYRRLNLSKGQVRVAKSDL